MRQITITENQLHIIREALRKASMHNLSNAMKLISKNKIEFASALEYEAEAFSDLSEELARRLDEE